MCVSIEDIDWSKMPEGAVKFSLANSFFAFSWYNTDEQFWVPSNNSWKKDGYPDNRTKYKVADYHPSMKQDKQKFTPVIGQPCTAVINGDRTLTVTPLYIGPKLLVVEISGNHHSFSVDFIKLLPLDVGYDNWVKPAINFVKNLENPTHVVTTLYTAMKEGRLDVPTF